MTPRILTYTFGNHMHWVDMEWLWGYHVLPGSVDDMLEFCKATGAKGNVNFDAIGYQKLAAEAHQAFSKLREAVRDGRIEIVGGSYGQPYGLFHGGESNVRQRVFGVRTIENLFGVRPITFWEEEFDFFPQLPQLLGRCGFRYGSLFFQWTWHTPHLPLEEFPAVWWCAPDGSRLLSATRNKLNLHQWPEDFDGLLNELAASPGPNLPSPSPPSEPHLSHASDVPGPHPPAPSPPEWRGGELVLQWLELMPSLDWMCRSEVLLPRMKEFLADPRFDVRFATLGEYLSDVSDAPIRHYAMDEVFHGMSLGKNADTFRLLSAEGERALLTAESIAALASLLGRPYAQWDVYPVWELEEAWRELLAAQHHDNDECEGLCGHVGRFSYERSRNLADHVKERTMRRFASACAGDEDSVLVFNPLPWARADTIDAGLSHPIVVRDLPPMGFQVVPIQEVEFKAMPWHCEGSVATASQNGMEFDLDVVSGKIRWAASDWPDGVLSGRLLNLSHRFGGEKCEWRFALARTDSATGDLVLEAEAPGDCRAEVWLKAVTDQPCLDITIKLLHLPRLDGGMNSGLRWALALNAPIERIVADTPYHFADIAPRDSYVRKYPSGDWMTSPQWFETIDRPFTGLSAVDLLSGSRGLLILHDRARQWFRTDDGVECLLTMYDPWDEENYDLTGISNFRLIPHGSMNHGRRWRLAQEFLRPAEALQARCGSTPPFTLECEPDNVAITSLYRETSLCGIDYPFVLRLVEWEGKSSTARITLPATVCAAYKTNLLGEEPSKLACGGQVVDCPVDPYEVATVVVELLEGRKQVRDLDAKRDIWATVHRIKSNGD